MALRALGITSRWRGDYAAGRRQFEEALAIVRRQGDPWGIANTLGHLGLLLLGQGDLPAALAAFEGQLAAGRRLGDRRMVGIALVGLGQVADEPEAARRLLEEGLALFRELGNAVGVASGHILLARQALRQGDPAAARQRFAAGLRGAQATGFFSRAVEGLEGLAAVAAATGQPARALRLAGAAAALQRGGGAATGPGRPRPPGAVAGPGPRRARRRRGRPRRARRGSRCPWSRPSPTPSRTPPTRPDRPTHHVAPSC